MTEEEAKRIAHGISLGHAYEKHVANLSESGDLLSNSSFESRILETLPSPAKFKQANNGRSAFWDEEEAFLVVVNPLDPDQGTAYWPTGGIDGYKDVR